jgi:hypothetical protein
LFGDAEKIDMTIKQIKDGEDNFRYALSLGLRIGLGLGLGLGFTIIIIIDMTIKHIKDGEDNFRYMLLGLGLRLGSG